MSLIYPSGNEVTPVLVNIRRSGSINIVDDMCPPFILHSMMSFHRREIKISARKRHKLTSHGNNENNNKMEELMVRLGIEKRL